jgi:hypothetical protein
VRAGEEVQQKFPSRFSGFFCIQVSGITHLSATPVSHLSQALFCKRHRKTALTLGAPHLPGACPCHPPLHPSLSSLFWVTFVIINLHTPKCAVRCLLLENVPLTMNGCHGASGNASPSLSSSWGVLKSYIHQSPEKSHKQWFYFA